MGSLLSKVETPQLKAEGDVDATNSDTENTNLAHEIERWERIYRQRFAREFMFSWGTRSPLWSMLYKPHITPDPWKFGPSHGYEESLDTGTFREADEWASAVLAHGTL